MGNLLLNLIVMSIAGSMIVGLMLLFRPVTVKIFPAKWQYGIGKIAIAFFLIPVSLLLRKLPLARPIMETYPAKPSTIKNALPSHNFVDAIGTLMEKHFTFEVMKVVLFIWLVGAIAFAGWHFYCYRRFSKQILADSFSVSGDTAVVILSSCKAALGIRGEVQLMLNPKITSPMIVGLRRSMILLPAFRISEIDLKQVFKHELMHLKRKDLLVKMLALIAETLHWFNPFVHVLRKDISTWGELSCDEALAREMSYEERKVYGEAILNMLDNNSSINTDFCSSLCESKKHIERRLTMLLNVKKTKKHIKIFSATVVLAIVSIGMTVPTLAAENTLQLEGGRNITIVSADGTIISYDKYGNATEGKERGKTPYSALELTYEEILERIKLHEDKGLPVPEAYLNAVNMEMAE